jgi:DNA-binding NarL/FixJ family response regulator
MIQRNKEDMTVVGEASNGREAVEPRKEHRPDVTLLDLRGYFWKSIDLLQTGNRRPVPGR